MGRAVAARAEVGHRLAKALGRVGGINKVEQDRQRSQRVFDANQTRHAATAQEIRALLARKLAAAQEQGGLEKLLGELAQSYGVAKLGNAMMPSAPAGTA